MKLCSLHSVDGIVFGAARETLEKFGAPVRKRKNKQGEDEFVFDRITFRFSELGFVEASFLTPSELEIDGKTITSGNLLDFLKANDPEYSEYVGFGIAPTLGLAYDLEHGGTWTTAFTKGRWDVSRGKSHKA